MTMSAGGEFWHYTQVDFNQCYWFGVAAEEPNPRRPYNQCAIQRSRGWSPRGARRTVTAKPMIAPPRWPS